MHGCDLVTIEFVLQPSSILQHHAVNFSSRQDNLEHDAQRIVCEDPECSLPSEQRAPPVRVPTDVFQQLLERQGARREEGWRWAAGDIVAEKGKGVNEDWEPERDEESTGPVSRTLASCSTGKCAVNGFDSA